MSTQTPTEERVNVLETKIHRVEAMLKLLLESGIAPLNKAGDETSETEIPVDSYLHLVQRPHSWRQQLFIKGRNLSVRQLVGTALANRMNEEEAAEDLSLPIEAIREAFAYFDQNKELLELESAFERYIVSQWSKTRGPQPVS